MDTTGLSRPLVVKTDEFGLTVFGGGGRELLFVAHDSGGDLDQSDTVTLEIPTNVGMLDIEVNLTTGKLYLRQN